MKLSLFNRQNPTPPTLKKEFSEIDRMQFGRTGDSSASMYSEGVGFTGQMVLWPLTIAPAGWLACDGEAYNITDYPVLFGVLNPFIGTCSWNTGTETVTVTAHGLVDGDQIFFKNEDGVFPTGITEYTNYYVVNKTTNTFQISATRTGGAALPLSGSPSGVQLLFYTPYGSTSSSFNVPSINGKTPFGIDYSIAFPTFANIGQSGGSAAAHSHTLTAGYAAIKLATAMSIREKGTANWARTRESAAIGGTTGSTVNNTAAELGGTTDTTSALPPYLVVQYIIKT